MNVTQAIQKLDREIIQDDEHWYLAGPMRNLPDFNFPAFDSAKADLASRGIAVISPADIDRDAENFDPTGMSGDPSELEAVGFCPVKAIQRDIDVILHKNCKGVIVLSGWENSRGSAVEVSIAKFLGKKVLRYPELSPVKTDMLTSADTKLSAIQKQRGQVYGEPKENHEGIAMIWACLLQPHWEAIRDNRPIPAHVVALMMAGLKLNRMRLVYHQDNYDDLRVYLQFAESWQADDRSPKNGNESDPESAREKSPDTGTNTP